jgi:hypothetical protein
MCQFIDTSMPQTDSNPADYILQKILDTTKTLCL